jgi:hypothetical protein
MPTWGGLVGGVVLPRRQGLTPLPLTPSDHTKQLFVFQPGGDP